MNHIARVNSILNCCQLDESITGFPSFKPSDLKLESIPEMKLPANKRLGHLVEVIVSKLIKSSKNYKLLFENLQLIENGKTIGEVDYILENSSEQLIHVELAYKFYLFDPSISNTQINNWIGPNRNDSLKQKLEKLKTKQFPLFYHDGIQSKLSLKHDRNPSQKLCFLVSLFIPYQYKEKLDSNFQKAIKGYYMDMNSFLAFSHSETHYFLPPKRDWGIDPAENHSWNTFAEVEESIRKSIEQRKSPLCWIKKKDKFETLFIVWW